MVCRKVEIAGGVAIACSRGAQKGRWCSHPGCGRKAEYLCDFRVNKRGKRNTTCDVPMCARHRTRVADDADYCARHAAMHRIGGKVAQQLTMEGTEEA